MKVQLIVLPVASPICRKDEHYLVDVECPAGALFDHEPPLAFMSAFENLDSSKTRDFAIWLRIGGVTVRWFYINTNADTSKAWWTLRKHMCEILHAQLTGDVFDICKAEDYDEKPYLLKDDGRNPRRFPD